jgi:very-short-patch-repair endonuclease
MVLEVDGKHHQEGTQTIRDYVRDRVLLREGIPSARFTAQECLSRAADVVTEFLNMF